MLIAQYYLNCIDLSQMQSVTLCMIERIIKLMKTQQEVQNRTLKQLERLQTRSNGVEAAVGELRYDLSEILRENRDFHKTNITLETLKLNVSREVLKEIRNNKQQLQRYSNPELIATTNKIPSCKNCNKNIKGRQSININQIIQDNSNGSNIQQISMGNQSKNSTCPLRRQPSLDISFPTQVSVSSIEKSNCSTHIFVPFDKYCAPSLYDYDKLVPQIALWTGQLFSELSENTYQRLKNNKLTKDQMKTFFSSNLILNSVLFMGYISQNYPYIWKPKRNDVLHAFSNQSKNALKYLMTKYTVKKRENIDNSNNQLKQFSSLNHPDNDSLNSTKIRFEFREDKQYSCKIKQVLNAYIKLTKRYYNRFQRQINKVSTIDLSPPQQYCITVNDMGNSKIMNNYEHSFLGPYHNNDISSLQAPPISNRNMSKSNRYQQQRQSSQPAPPVSSPKILKGLIGMKIKPETGLYTLDELKQKGIKIKTAQVLRVIIKWIDDLEKKINDISAITVEKDTPFASKEVGGVPVDLTHGQKELLRSKIEESVKRFQAANVELGEVEAALTQLYPCIEKNKGTFRFIPQNEVIVGLATYILSDPVSKITTGYLQSLIHCLLEAESNFNKQSDCQPISLLSFGIYDLLRAKFEGTKEEVVAVYNNLCENKSFKVIRIKNRLDTINRDFLINLRLVDTPLICELQLGVTLQAEKEVKSQSFENFSHFLYELDRAKYGPFIEAVITNNHQSPTVAYFQNALKQLKVKTLDFEVSLNDQGNLLTVQSYIPIHSDAPFSCKNCWKFVYPSSSFLQSFEQDKVGKGKAKKICGNCIIERLSPEDQKRYLLGKMGGAFQQIKINQIAKLKDSSKKYVCLILNGSKKNVKVLQVQGSVGGVTELVQTFVEEDIICQIYELQDLSISQAFQLKDEIALECTQISQLTESDILSNSQLSLSDLNNKQYLTVPLQSGRLILDVWCELPQQKASKQSRINNIKGVMNSLKDQSQSQGNIKSRILSFISSTTIVIPNRKLNGIDIFVSPNLQILNVSENNIVMLDMNKYNMPELQELDLSYNQIVGLDFRGGNYGKLRSLKAQWNQIEYFLLDDALSELAVLDLGSNRLEGVALFQAIKLANLSVLIIENNFMQNINMDYCELPELKILNLKHNYITQLSDFSRLQKLEVLDLSINFIQQANFNNKFGSLLKLDMSSNRLNKISGLQFPNLQQLNLGFNYLQNFNLTELINTKVEKLNLAYNKITQIHYQQGMIKTLRELLLQKNKITEFKWDKSIRANPFIRMADRRSMHEFTDQQVLGILNWQLNLLNVQQISGIARYLNQQSQSEKQIGIIRTSYQDSAPYVRYDTTDINLIKDLISTYSMIPEENPASSLSSMRQVEYRVSSLNQSAATRLRRIIEENL